MTLAEAAIGMLVRLTAVVRAKGVMHQPWRGERRPDWTGRIEKLIGPVTCRGGMVNGPWAICSHPEEFCGCHLTLSLDCDRCDGTGGAVRRRVLLDEIEADTRNLVVALILRRLVPARALALDDCRKAYLKLRAELLDHPYLLRYVPLRAELRRCWRREIDVWRGAQDQLIGELRDGRLCLLHAMPPSAGNEWSLGNSRLSGPALEFLEVAHDEGYWENPRTLRWALKHPVEVPRVQDRKYSIDLRASAAEIAVELDHLEKQT